MKIEDDFLVLVATNEVEKERLLGVLDKVMNFYKKQSYFSKKRKEKEIKIKK